MRWIHFINIGSFFLFIIFQIFKFTKSVYYFFSYNISEAIGSLVPSTGPVLCRDEMEEWSASEANLFEEALEKYGKDFNDIRQDFVIPTRL